MKRILLGIAAAALVVGGTASMSMAAEKLNINGSTTVLPIMQKMVESYMKANPGVEISVSGGGSGNGIKALLDKTTDIAMSSRELKSSEQKLAAEKNVSPQSIAIAVDAVLPIVHPSNPVTNLSVDQLKGIYSGNIRNWKDVGGEDRKIVVVSRDSSSGTFEAWNELVLKGSRVTPAAMMQASSGAVIQVIAGNKFAIGYDSYGYLNNTVKAINVNGIAGNPENAANGTYPVSRKLWIMVDGTPSAAVQKFIDYILSPAGQKIVKECGAVPVK